MEQARKPGWWYPYIFVGGFAVVLAVNGALAYFATSSFTGLSTEQPYEKGLAYNQNLAMAKAQADMGWTVETTVTPVPAKDSMRAADITISYRDRDGRPVEGMVVTAMLVRPVERGFDHEITLPAKGNGVYGGTYPLARAGAWDIDVVAKGISVAYEHNKRFVIP